LQPPPPPLLPETSRKRILPAFLLCFTIGAHRLYVGKIISGIIQIVWVIGGLLWSYVSLKGLIAVVHTGPQDIMSVVERISDWKEAHGGMPLTPSFVMIGIGIWIAIDAGKLLAGKFTDGKGLRITRWV
jgi:TM2 domain